MQLLPMPSAIAESMLAQPWSIRMEDRAAADNPHPGGRPVLIVSADVDRAILESTGEELPLVGYFVDPRRFEWRKFEVPTPVGTSNRLRLRLVRNSGSSATLLIRLPGETESFAEAASISPDSAAEAFKPAAILRLLADDESHRMTGLHLDLMHRLHESANAEGRMIWDAAGGGVAAWPLRDVLTAWREVGRQSGPGPALIVSLARRIGPALRRVCDQPRSRLRRQRAVQPAGRIQQMDAACVKWLARQPGVTVAERVGSRQQALGVSRIAETNSMENRLVRRLLDELIEEADRYMEDHADDPAHQRVVEVETFRHEVNRLRIQTPIAQIPRLTGLPHPNYTLQHDPRYRPLFQAYAMLLDQRGQRERVWRWRQRIWGESCELLLLAALQRIQPHAAAMRSKLLLRPEPRCGRFIDRRSGIGRFDLYLKDKAYNLLLLDRQQFVQDSPGGALPEQLGALCPDALLVVRDGQKPDQPAKQIVAVWSVLDFDLNADHLHSRCEEIALALRQIPTPTELRGLVLQPKLTAPNPDSDKPTPETTAAGCIQEKRVRGCLGLRLSIPLQRHETLLATLLREELGLNP